MANDAMALMYAAQNPNQSAESPTYLKMAGFCITQFSTKGNNMAIRRKRRIIHQCLFRTFFIYQFCFMGQMVVVILCAPDILFAKIHNLSEDCGVNVEIGYKSIL